MVQTATPINSNTKTFSGGGKKSMTKQEYRNELREIISLTNQAKKRLLSLVEETSDDGVTDSLEEALEALHVAADSMEDVLENGKE